jgi:branched-subunit amino acid aminotransferase/4-amino-4-deoxychorismate lyase
VLAPYEIGAGVADALRRFRLPEKLGFGATQAPVMFSAAYREGSWERGRLIPHAPIEIWPGARALQYAELVFEGLKAYRVQRPQPNLFRPEMNCQRFARSAERLAMPIVPEGLFFQAIESVTRSCADLIPGESGRSLYLRPFLFGTESGYLLRNSQTFSFMVIANPVESYASGAASIAIERRMDIDELLTQVREGRCSELFACGTAAIVMPIAALADADGREYRPRVVNAVAAGLREALLAIQERRTVDPIDWTRIVE